MSVSGSANKNQIAMIQIFNAGVDLQQIKYFDCAGWKQCLMCGFSNHSITDNTYVSHYANTPVT
jgi:hypothetical protein